MVDGAQAERIDVSSGAVICLARDWPASLFNGTCSASRQPGTPHSKVCSSLNL
jgi:hypothetical protein